MHRQAEEEVRGEEIVWLRELEENRKAHIERKKKIIIHNENMDHVVTQTGSDTFT